MVINTVMSHQFKFKFIPGFRTFLFPEKKDIHYIGGSEVLPAPLAVEEEAEAINELGSKDDEYAKKVLIEHNLRLVVYIAKKFDNTGVGVEDLISIGTIGLIKAINTFNPTKNIKLATYASRCIENEILMHFRSQKKTAADVSLSEALDVDGEGNGLYLMDVVAQDDDMAERVGSMELCRSLREYIDKVLDEREAEIIRLRYGIGGGTPKTQRETAQLCGISRSYISRIEKKALEKLREALGDESGK